ncbi:unnamed protein product, partial [Hapterophycus canaliculatus]
LGCIRVVTWQVGAWEPFDEFYRSNERILLAVSQQILAIQRGRLGRPAKVETFGRSVSLHPEVNTFVTRKP